MKISNKQLIMLFDIAKASLAIRGDTLAYSQDTRLKLVNDILNQQSEELIDITPRDVKQDELNEEMKLGYKILPTA